MTKEEFMAELVKLLPAKPDSVTEWMALEMLHVLDETATLEPRKEDREEETI